MEKIKQSKVDGPKGYLVIFNRMVRVSFSQVTFEPKQGAGGEEDPCGRRHLRVAMLNHLLLRA